MELIHADASMKELRFIDSFTQFDACVSLEEDVNGNSWQLSMPVECYQANPIAVGDYVYIEQSEWGGAVEQVRHNSLNHTVEISGLCWRGCLLRAVIRPPDGEAHLVATGEDGNEVIAALLNGQLGSLFQVSGAPCPMNYRHSFRYATLLGGITDTLTEYGCRLDVTFADGRVTLCAEPPQDYSAAIEFSDDWDCRMTAQAGCVGRCNHILALGSGEQLERDVVELWLLPDGSITDDPQAQGVPTGSEVRTYLYDFSGAESRSTLTTYAKRKLKEFSPMPRLDFEPSSDFTELKLGDLVGARDNVVDAALKMQITQKLLTIDSGGINLRYSVAAYTGADE